MRESEVARYSTLEGSGGKSTHLFYLSKSINTAILKCSVTSKSLEFKMYCKSVKALASKVKYQK